MAAIPPAVETLEPGHNEQIARTLTGGSTRNISEKKQLGTPEGAPVPPSLVEAVAEPPVFRKTRKYWIVIASFYFFFFVLGFNGGSTGPLLPRYQEYYKIDYLIVSMVFVSNACGSLTAAAITHFFGHRLSFSTIVIGASLIPLIGYSIMASLPPFPVMCICFYINGINFSLVNIQVNGILALLPSKTPLGLGHSLFGAGALVAPLVSTQFAQPQVERWSFHYLVLLGAAVADCIALCSVFWGRGLEDVLKEMGIPSSASEEKGEAAFPTSTEGSPVKESSEINSKEEDVRGILPKKLYTSLLALFTFICVGVEVSIGGWIVTFIINERGGGPTSGYISTGYYAGLSFGRAALIWVNSALGERNAVFLYIILVIALELTIWFVHSLVGNAFAVAVVGCLLGPLFPIVMSQARRLVPRQSLTASIGWIAGMGQVGSALLPFATGALANRYGIGALHPLITVMMAVLGALWFLVPPIRNTHSRQEVKDSSAAV